MQRQYCDLCGEEISLSSLPGGVVRQVETYPIQNLGDMLLNSDHKPPIMISKAIRPEIWDLCEKCQKWIWILVEKRKQNIGSDTKIALTTNLIKSINYENKKSNH